MSRRITTRELQSAAEYLSEAAENIKIAADLCRVERLKETASMVEALASEIRAESMLSCG